MAEQRALTDAPNPHTLFHVDFIWVVFSREES